MSYVRFFALWLSYSIAVLSYSTTSPALWGSWWSKWLQSGVSLLYMTASKRVTLTFYNPAYYRYLNAHGRGTTALVFLLVGASSHLVKYLWRQPEYRFATVAILDAGQNALSFFMLLVISLGLSVVRESLGTTMYKCQALAAAHFIFGGRSSCSLLSSNAIDWSCCL